MAEGYTGVRVINVGPEIVNQAYIDQRVPLSQLDGRITRHLSQNEYCVLKFENPPNSQSALTRVIGGDFTLLRGEVEASGIRPRNKEQRMALDALLDDNIKVVVLTGTAGSGKTICTLAAAMTKFEEGRYERLILTRTMSWVGKHALGFLPGEASEKFGPYLENYMCNIEYLLGGKHKSVQDTIQQYRMDFIPPQLIRGASWMNAFIIADEWQTMGVDETVALGTRVGEGSKIVIMGDLLQRDENIARDQTGIYQFVNNELAKQSPLVASIDLWKSERSEVSSLFADVFER